jgi:hypothetical protein
MPRPLNYTLLGGESSTKGERGVGLRGLGESGVTSYSTVMGPTFNADTAGDLADFNANNVVSELDSTVSNVGADFTGTSGTLASLVNNFAGTVSSGSSTGIWILAGGAAVVLVLLTMGRRR